MYYTKIYNKATVYESVSTVYVSELILTRLSTFDIKCKNLNAENLYLGG